MTILEIHDKLLKIVKLLIFNKLLSGREWSEFSKCDIHKHEFHFNKHEFHSNKHEFQAFNQ